MSLTATVTATSQPNSFRPGPPSPNRSRLNRSPQPRQPHRSVTHQTGSAVNPNMSSAAAYPGQRAVPYNTMASNRDAYKVAPIDRWEAAREIQDFAWRNAHQPYPPQTSGQQRQQYQPTHVPLQPRQATSSNTVTRQSTRAPTPSSTHSTQAASSAGTLNGDAQSMVMHSMQIPARISPKGGNLADFAAQVSPNPKHTKSVIKDLLLITHSSLPACSGSKPPKFSNSPRKSVPSQQTKPCRR